MERNAFDPIVISALFRLSSSDFPLSLMLPSGSLAPDFSLQDQDGKRHSLADERGRYLLLYFYPKDDTSGCTTEACRLRDSMDEYREANCVVFGVSADTVESHDAFAKKLNLPYPILADTDKETIRAYKAWGEKTSQDGTTKMGILRISYLIDPEGRIVKAYPNVDPERHAAEVVANVKGLTA
jgi:thioredoxin-dependent peroxiredoxin